MRRLFLRCAAVLVWLFISLPHAYTQTQAEMNAEARTDFNRDDAELNKTYQSVFAKLPNGEKQKLKEAQRRWIASRDAEAARAAREAQGGSMASTIRYETMSELTRKRITELKAIIDKLSASAPQTEASQSPNDYANSGPHAEPGASAAPDSISPDKKWKYTCEEYGIGQCAPKIVNAGSSDVALDLEAASGSAAVLVSKPPPSSLLRL